MSGERDDRRAALERLYDRARRLPPEERDTLLEEACDAEARVELRELLGCEDEAKAVFDRLEACVREPPGGAFDPRVAPGETIGAYEIVDVLGRGGMGVVYRARDPRLDRPVALKLLPPWLGEDPDAVRRFVGEAKAASATDHPNIATIYEIEETEDGAAYIAMACYEGETLAERLARGPLPPAEAAGIVRQAAAGLAAAHRRGIVHRDVKPANLFVTDEGRVKVLDFGIAKIAGGDATRTGSRRGTPSYMSPEQARGEAVDARTDVWSLGVVLHEALSGRRPFGGDRPVAVVRAILDDDPPAPDPPEGRCPSRLARIVDRALRKDPAERYPDAEALEDELAAWEGSPGSRSSSKRRAVSPARAGLVALVVFALAALAAGVWWPDGPDPVATAPSAATASSRVVVLPFEVRGSPDLEYLEEGFVHLLAASLDGAAGLRTTDPRAVLDHLHRTGGSASGPAGADEVAARFGAGRFVLGDAVEVAGRLRIEAALYRRGADAEPITRAYVEGDVARLFDLVDELTSQLLVADRPDRGMVRVAAVTTPSIEAFKAYLEGDRARRRGRFDAAVDAFRRAVERDSLFALAHYQLSKSAGWTRRRDLARREAERAARHAGSLTPHLRDLLLAHRAYWRGEMAVAEGLYRRTLAEAPENVDAWYELGEVLFHANPPRGRSRVEAREAFERALAIDPAHGEPLVHLLDLAAWEGDTARFASLYERLAGEGDVPLQWRTMRSIVLGGEADRRSIELELTEASDLEVYQSVTRAAIAGRSLGDIARFVRVLFRPSRSVKWRARAHHVLARVELGRGRIEAARESLRAMRRIDPVTALEHEALLALHPLHPADVPRLEALRRELRALDPTAVGEGTTAADEPHAGLHPEIRHYLLGLLNARLGDLDLARDHALALERTPGEGDAGEAAAAFAASVRAHEAWHGGRIAEALDHLESARMGAIGRERRSPLFQGPYERFVRAELLRLLGRHEEAIAWFGAAGDYGMTELPYLAPSLMRRAEIAALRGELGEARTAWARSVDLWRDADSELQPMVRQARARLAALRGDARADPR